MKQLKDVDSLLFFRRLVSMNTIRLITRCGLSLGLYLTTAYMATSWAASADVLTPDNHNTEEAEAARAAARAELEQINPIVQKLSRAFNLVHQITRPSVVSIHTKSETINRFTMRRRTREVGEGSGFVFASDDTYSYILTNAHVVIYTKDNGDPVKDRNGHVIPFDGIRTETFDNRAFEATFLGADVNTDLAVLRIDNPRMPTTQWGDSDQTHVGDWVVALGFPLGVGYSATTGIVSAIARSTSHSEQFESFIQTDAAINPGNSGGPLLNLQSKVIGVNARIKSGTGQSVGLGFAIPANLAHRVAEDLKIYGRFYRPMIGIVMKELKPGDAKEFDIDNPRAVFIARVYPISPAKEAGLQLYDVITAINDIEINGLEHAQTLLASTSIGDTVSIKVWRDGESLILPLTPIAEDAFIAELEEHIAKQRNTTQVFAEYGMSFTKDEYNGIVINNIVPNGAADSGGFLVGDRILKIEGFGPIHSADEFTDIVLQSNGVRCIVHSKRRYVTKILRKD